MAFLAVTPPSHHRPHRHEGTPPPSPLLSYPLYSELCSLCSVLLLHLYYRHSLTRTHTYTFIKAMLTCPPLSTHHSSLPSHHINTYTLPPPPPLFRCPNTHTNPHTHSLTHYHSPHLISLTHTHIHAHSMPTMP